MKVVVSYGPGVEHLDQLRNAAPRATIEVVGTEDDARRAIVDADAFLGNQFFLQSVGSARRLRWMQSGSMGVDEILDRVGSPQFVMTRVRDCYEGEVSEHALTLLLAASRRIADFARDRQNRIWEPRPLPTLAGRSAIVLGLGGIGIAVATRLDALGMRVVGVRATHVGPPVRAPWGQTHGPATWRAHLSTAAALVLALPRTAGTRHLVGAAELAALADGAVVVNVGRGGTLDDAALVIELERGRLLAGLDVFEDEPLAPDHALWDAPGLVMTPHVGRAIEPGRRAWEPLFVENLARFHRGDPLLHVVDPARGY